MKKTRLEKILSRFDQVNILVIGDLILDEFIWGTADRISPEAPVPVVWAQRQSTMPGGASNVANNIASLGANAFLCGIIGEDKNGATLLDQLQRKRVSCDAVLTDRLRPTTVKTRIIAAHQQVVRVDWENVERLSMEKTNALVRLIQDKIKDVDAIIIEDYGKGLITPALLKAVVAEAKKHGKIVTIDPKVEHFSYYKGVTALTPNEKEASAGSGIPIVTKTDADRAGSKLLKKINCKGVLITQGEKGMTLYTRGRATHIPTVAQEVFDVSGAGDTVISVFTLALASGASMQEAAVVANLAAGIVVGKVGVAVATKQEILKAWSRLKGWLS
ncbi:MAG: D-glycero-beta-D-manno-heptose-7-phosphate kinase [Candidatus Omnitrophota bacterium]